MRYVTKYIILTNTCNDKLVNISNWKPSTHLQQPLTHRTVDGFSLACGQIPPTPLQSVPFVKVPSQRYLVSRVDDEEE